MAFRDEFERKAHDIICIVKYGSPGGSATPKEVQRIGDILRGGPYRPPVVMIPLPTRPAVVVPPPPFTLPVPAKVL